MKLNLEVIRVEWVQCKSVKNLWPLLTLFCPLYCFKITGTFVSKALGSLECPLRAVNLHVDAVEGFA